MKIKKPNWVDDNPHKAGKRLSNIYWGENPVWKRDEEIFTWAELDQELVIYNHTFIYYHKKNEIFRESFKTQGSQVPVYHIPSGYVLLDSTFVLKKHGTNVVNVVKENYTIKFKCTHSKLGSPIEIIVKKPYKANMSLADARNEMIASGKLPSGYDVDVPKFTEFPDNLLIDDDFEYNVPLKESTSVVPAKTKTVTIKYYLIEGTDQRLYKTEVQRHLVGNFDYNISIPLGYEQTNRVDNDDTNTTIWIKEKIYAINIRLATYKNGNINKVWYSYRLERKYNNIVTVDDLEPIPENIYVGVAPNKFKVTLEYTDDFTFDDITVVNDMNIDIAVKASMKLVEIVTDVDVPRITEAGVGVYTYGLPTGVVKENSMKTIKVKFIANSYDIDNNEKVFAVVFPYNPVKGTIIGNGIDIIGNNTYTMSSIKSGDFLNNAKTNAKEIEWNNDDGIFDKLRVIDSSYVFDEGSSYFTGVVGMNGVTNVIYTSDQFSLSELKNGNIIKPNSQIVKYKVFDKDFDWTLMDTTDIDKYDTECKCWLIISNIVLHILPVSNVKFLEKCVAYGLPYHQNAYPIEMVRSVHGTLPYIQIYEPFIDVICPLIIKDYRYYLCDNAKDFITDVTFKVKTIEEYTMGSYNEGYNRNIIGNFLGLFGTSYLKYSRKASEDHTSVFAENPSFLDPNKWPNLLGYHLAYNWYKSRWNKDGLLIPELYEQTQKDETSMICFNFWDMVNHAIGKSLLRNHNVDNTLKPMLDKIGNDISIFVNLLKLPVVIDTTNDKFPKMTLDMKEKDFGVGVFTNKKPIISFSPVNRKRIIQKLPRVTYMQNNAKELDYKIKLSISDFNKSTVISHEYAFINDIDREVTINKPLYAYRPEFYETYSNTSYLTSQLSVYTTYNNSILIQKSSSDPTLRRINMYKYRKNYKLNARPNYINPNIDSKYARDVADSYVLLVNDNELSEFMDIMRDKLYINDRWKTWNGTSIEDVTKFYDPFIRNRLNDILNYNNTITIFDNWKEEISYDNPQ